MQLKARANSALDTLSVAFEEAESSREEIVDGLRVKNKDRFKKILEKSPEYQQAAERVDRLVLFQILLRNIKMNLGHFTKNGPNLRLNQLNSIEKLIEFIEAEGNGALSGYIKQPTGAGKTVLFGVITRLCSVPTLIFVPKTNLLTQTKQELVEVVGIPEDQIGLVGGGQKDYNRPIRIVTYQSHRSLYSRDEKYMAAAESCQLVICDEAHRSLGSATQESIESLDGEFDDYLTVAEQSAENSVLADLNRYTPARALKLGFTATPMLAAKHVEDAFGELIAEEKHADLVKAGILVPYRIVQADGSLTESDIEKYLTEESEIAILRRENSYRKLLGKYMDVLSEFKRAKKNKEYPMRGVAFCVRIDECDRFAQEAESLGLKVKVVTSRETEGMNGKAEQAFLKIAEDELLAGEIDIVATVGKLAEGWNFPPANAAIWARVSRSPALIMQGVGRTARTYVDEKGRKKNHSYVFETKWKSKKQNKRSPLNIADALACMGEDPNKVCIMNNNEKLYYKVPFDYIDLGTGTVNIGDTKCIGIAAYANCFGVDHRSLSKIIVDAKIQPIGKAISGKHTVDVFPKQQVDDLQKFKDLISRKKLVAGSSGIVSCGEGEFVCLRPYADFLGVSGDFLIKLVGRSDLKPSARGLSGSTTVDLYNRNVVDALPDLISALQAKQNELSPEFTVNIGGEICVGLNGYARFIIGMMPDNLKSLVGEAGFEPRGVARSGNNTIDVYLKSEIDSLPEVASTKNFLDDRGIVKINNINCIGIAKYSVHRGLVFKTVKARVLNAGIKSVGFARSGNKVIEIYPQEAVDELFSE